MYTYKNETGMGFGNVLIHLAASHDVCRKIHDDFYSKYELSTCVTFKGYEVVTDNDPQPECDIFIGHPSHQRITEFVEPTPFMKRLIDANKHLIEGVVAGIHIRRGAFARDATPSRTENPRHFYHCSDDGVSQFENIIRSLDGPVYLASDSKELKHAFKNTFRTKVRTLECGFALTGASDLPDQTPENYHKAYLEWFLLSMCPKLYISGGTKDFVGFTTYSYTAGIYGKKPTFPIFNEETTYTVSTESTT